MSKLLTLSSHFIPDCRSYTLERRERVAACYYLLIMEPVMAVRVSKLSHTVVAVEVSNPTSYLRDPPFESMP